MPGPPPKKPDQRRRTNKPASGEWKAAPGTGWQHGKKPEPPRSLQLHDESKKAWRSWFSSWWASNWTPEDLPGLTLVIREYDKAVRGTVDLTKIQTLLDSYGITPMGRQKLHWLPPKTDAPAAKPTAAPSGKPKLRVVDASA